MKLCTYAGTDLVIEAKNDKAFYPKGAFIQLEVDKNDDPVIVHHRLVEKEQLLDQNDPDSKKVKVKAVETKYFKFTRLDDLRFMAENVFFEDQFSPVINLIDVTMADALLKEHISPDLMTVYLSNKQTSLQKSYIKDGVTHLRIPVKPLAKDIPVIEKLKTLAKFDRIDTSRVKVEDVAIVSAREKNRLQETKYLIVREALIDGVDDLLPDYICSKIIEAAPQDWKVRVVEGTIRATINGAFPYSLYNILETIPVDINKSFVQKEEDSYIEISMRIPELPQLVESFYSKPVAYDKYIVLEDDDSGNGEKKEGDPCEAKGKKGKLKKSGDGFVCMVDESYETDLDLDEVFLEGDSCGPDGQGTLRMIGENLCCVVENTSYTQHYTGYKTFTEEGKEGDACEKDGKKGKLCKVGDNLVCKIEESNEQVLFTCVTEDSAMPCEGDSCEMHGRPGKLMMVNGALICSLGGEPPAGADSGAGDGGALESLLADKGTAKHFVGKHQPSDLEMAASWGDKHARKKFVKKTDKWFKKMGVHDPDDD